MKWKDLNIKWNEKHTKASFWYKEKPYTILVHKRNSVWKVTNGAFYTGNTRWTIPEINYTFNTEEHGYCDNFPVELVIKEIDKRI